ncbi:MAG: DUF6680 family protein [Flavisolibacter sp.]
MELISALIGAIIGSVITAVLTYYYQQQFDKKKEKIEILKALMANRHLLANSQDWVKAFNIIPVVFKNDSDICNQQYHFCSYTKTPDWHQEKAREILYSLILLIAHNIGYTSFEESELHNFYGPEINNQITSEVLAKISFLGHSGS